MHPTTNGGVREVSPMNKMKISYVSDEIQVDPNQKVRKLPNGINLVSIMRPRHGNAIQVKLPFTGM